MECGGLPQVASNIFKNRLGLLQRLFKHPSFFLRIKSQVYVRISMALFGLIPLAANVFAVVILRTPQLRRDQPSFRHHLLLLTLSEIFYCTTFILFWTSDVLLVFLTVRTNLSQISAVVTTLLRVFMETFLMTRNWMVVAISAARCEAVTRPLGSLKSKFFTSRKVRVFMVVIFLSALSLSLMDGFSNFWRIYCLRIVSFPRHADNATTNSSHRRYQQFSSDLTRVRMRMKMFYFRGLPIFFVIITTVIIVAAICRKKPVMAQSQSTFRSATTTLIGFTILFTIIEGFGFTYYMVQTFVRNLNLSQATWVTLSTLDKYLLMTNVIAYVAFNQAFRSAAKEFVTRRRLSVIGGSSSRQTELKVLSGASGR